MNSRPAARPFEQVARPRRTLAGEPFEIKFMAKSKSWIGRIFGGLWAGVEALRRLIVLLFLLVLVGMAYLAWQGGPPVEVDEGVALVLVPFGQIVERDDSDPRERVLGRLLGEEPPITVLGDMIDAIDAAAADPRIALLFLKLDTGFVAGQAQLSELAAAAARFRDSGKPVYAYAPDLGQDEYFLAAVADQIFIDPLGMVFLPGFEYYPLYFNEALDKLGVAVNVFRAGEFKSAVEPFIRNSMSESARANAQRWLNGLWDGWRDDVTAARALDAGAVQAYADNYVSRLREAGGDNAELALASGLVDAAVPLQTVREAAGEIVGMDEEHGSFRQIDHYRYLRALRQENGAKPEPPADKDVSLVVVQGEIVDGESAPGFAGGDAVADLIDRARQDDRSAALVLRVESPGGSVFASEQIRRAVQRYRDSGRPVVVSMASIAASGGYWISMNADEIFAYDTTLTGSIGVFGLVPTVDQGLGKLGIHSDGVGTTVWSGGLSPLRPLSEAAQQGLQLMVERDYRRFIDQVAAARNIEPTAMDEIAQGRVWTGEDALELGLVDALGNRQQAVERAAELAELEHYNLAPVEPVMDIRIRLLDRFSRSTLPLPTGWSRQLGAWLGEVERLQRRWSDRRGVYAHCLCRY